jgi:hypothetical protein
MPTIITGETGVNQITSGTIVAADIANTTGSGNIVLATSPSISSPVITGVTSASNAASGVIGEIISSTVASPGTALSGSTAVDLTTISLTAGDWDVSGSVYYTGSGATSTLYWIMGHIQTSPSGGSMGAGNPGMLIQTVLNNGIWTQTDTGGVCGPYRFSLNSTTTLYLVSRANASGGTVNTYGHIRARRVR